MLCLSVGLRTVIEKQLLSVKNECNEGWLESTIYVNVKVYKQACHSSGLTNSKLSRNAFVLLCAAL